MEFIRDIKTRILPPKEVIMGDRQLERDAENWIKGWTIQFNINNLNDKFVESHRTVYDRTISMLKDMIEYCKEEKLRLVLVIPPMHRSLCRKFPSVAKEQLIDSFITEANGGRHGTSTVWKSLDFRMTNPCFATAIILTREEPYYSLST